MDAMCPAAQLDRAVSLTSMDAEIDDNATGEETVSMHELLAAQTPFAPYHWSVAPSPYLDLSNGWEGYQASQLAAHAQSFKRAMGKWRRAQREAGPIVVA